MACRGGRPAAPQPKPKRFHERAAAVWAIKNNRAAAVVFIEMSVWKKSFGATSGRESPPAFSQIVRVSSATLAGGSVQCTPSADTVTPFMAAMATG